MPNDKTLWQRSRLYHLLHKEEPKVDLSDAGLWERSRLKRLIDEKGIFTLLR
jgi:hypothetical protein